MEVCDEMETTMGRPPIGKVAMTGAERTRLWRQKQARADAVTKPVTKSGKAHKPQADTDAGARIRELKAEYASVREQLATAQANGESAKLAKLRPLMGELMRKLDRAQRAAAANTSEEV